MTNEVSAAKQPEPKKPSFAAAVAKNTSNALPNGNLEKTTNSNTPSTPVVPLPSPQSTSEKIEPLQPGELPMPANGLSSMSSVVTSGPDADAIKMFVGQLPKSWNEDTAKNMFKKYGQIYSLNILRDKQTGDSKGCCFITYVTREAALSAQNDLHNVKILDGVSKFFYSNIAVVLNHFFDRCIIRFK